jgi:hypothetical protein
MDSWDECTIKKKVQGPGLMVSGFYCPCHGLLQPESAIVRIIKEPGKNRYGYSKSDDLVRQLEMAVEVYENLHPGCVAILLWSKLQPPSASKWCTEYSNIGARRPTSKGIYTTTFVSSVTDTLSNKPLYIQKTIQLWASEEWERACERYWRKEECGLRLWNWTARISWGRLIQQDNLILSQQPDFLSQRPKLENAWMPHAIFFHISQISLCVQFHWKNMVRGEATGKKWMQIFIYSAESGVFQKFRTPFPSTRLESLLDMHGDL